ncbi:MAG: hypothetical protein ACKVZJ_12510 [Phycisphaerales bacterium]
MFLATIALTSAVAFSAQGTGTAPVQAVAAPVAPAPVVLAQFEPVASFAQLVPTSVAAPSAAIALLGPVMFRRSRPFRVRAERRTELSPLPQNYMYFPAAR